MLFVDAKDAQLRPPQGPGFFSLVPNRDFLAKKPRIFSVECAHWRRLKNTENPGFSAKKSRFGTIEHKRNPLGVTIMNLSRVRIASNHLPPPK